MRKKLTFQWDENISKEWREKFKEEIPPTLESYYSDINRYKPGRIRVNMFGLIGTIIYEEIEDEIPVKNSEICCESVETGNIVPPELEKTNRAEERVHEISQTKKTVTAKTVEVSEATKVVQESLETENHMSLEIENENKAEAEDNVSEPILQATSLLQPESAECAESFPEHLEQQNLVYRQTIELIGYYLLNLYVIYMEFAKMRLIMSRWCFCAFSKL
jgi:hypothetical protein